MRNMEYKNTVILPKTEFPMRAGSPKKEPEILAFWQSNHIFDQLRTQSKGQEKYVLHGGPPYANGNLHCGHAMNYVLKDVVVKFQQMSGKDASHVPGWDCHGLPIEWKIEEQYRSKGQDKDAVDILTFRQECRDFAQKWVGIQSEEFQRLGVVADWQNPYLTMDLESEAMIVKQIHKFLLNDSLYKGVKPVMWSTVEKTALADAEIEYKDVKSTMIWVKFPIVSSNVDGLEGAQIVIWTTTPWTIPGNRLIACGSDIDYQLIEIQEVDDEKSLLQVGDHLLIAKELLDAFYDKTNVVSGKILKTFSGAALKDTICHHPLHGQGYEFDVPVHFGEFVTTETGTGFVHCSPTHGEDDFHLGRKHGIEIPQMVTDDGKYYDHVPLFAGETIYDHKGRKGTANKVVIEALKSGQKLAGIGSYEHSYPHSWRSKAPVIFRTTPQWFIAVDDGLKIREKALKSIEEVNWVPQQGHNRIKAMVSDRPDWCVSRQRAWGVPISIYMHKETGEPLRDPKICERIFNAYQETGSDCWFHDRHQEFIGSEYDLDEYEIINDIVDVWFESGSTHEFVLKQRDELQWPADLYLEGSDQHRGWFQSSLLNACGTEGKAPYKAVLTHGFLLDEKGMKMSKSIGNTITPEQIIKQYGADILRLWVINSDYTNDVKLGNDILKSTSDLYRRLRNTLRYLLGALGDMTPQSQADVSYDALPELEQWVLNRLYEVNQEVKATTQNYDFHQLFTSIHTFASNELSAFYFDIRKDALYCDSQNSPRRQASLIVMDQVFQMIVKWLAPIVSFTAEEAWQMRRSQLKDEEMMNLSVHLCEFEELPKQWACPQLAKKWERIRDIRRVVTGAIELDRANKTIGSSLQAAPLLYLSESDKPVIQEVDLNEICITSQIEILFDKAPDDAFKLEQIEDISVVNEVAKGNKCERCWQVLPEVGELKEYDSLCQRCATVIEKEWA